MSDDEYTLEDYIEYHRQPGIKMVAISDFNEILGSNIEENPEVEQVLYKLRQQFGPNELIPPLALTAAEKLQKAAASAAKKNKKKKKNKERIKKIKGGIAKAGSSATKRGKALGKGAVKGAIKAGNYIQKKLASGRINKAHKAATNIVLKHTLKTAKDKVKLDKQNDIIDENCKINPKNKHCSKPRPELCKKSGYSEMSTSLEDELIEDEYEETCDKCGEVTTLCDHEFEDQLEEVSIEDAQTLQHLVAFKSKCTNVRERMMKGKGRYIEQLKAYLNGDDNAEVRMFTGKKVKVSSLNPNKESLKSLFESFPSGPHIVECD